MPTLVLCMSTRARRSLLERLPRKSLTNLLAYLRLSPQPPHCHALRFSRSGASSHVQRSMRPALHALANAWVKPAEEMAYKKAVSLKPGKWYHRGTDKNHSKKEVVFKDYTLSQSTGSPTSENLFTGLSRLRFYSFVSVRLFCMQIQQTILKQMLGAIRATVTSAAQIAPWKTDYWVLLKISNLITSYFWNYVFPKVTNY